MTRNELLTKAAMELEVWPYDNAPHMRLSGHYSGGFTYQETRNNSCFTKGDWLQRRSELINEPDDADAPTWARWKGAGSEMGFRDTR